jgi:hypothetical protein
MRVRNEVVPQQVLLVDEYKVLLDVLDGLIAAFQSKEVLFGLDCAFPECLKLIKGTSRKTQLLESITAKWTSEGEDLGRSSASTTLVKMLGSSSSPRSWLFAKLMNFVVRLPVDFCSKVMIKKVLPMSAAKIVRLQVSPGARK